LGILQLSFNAAQCWLILVGGRFAEAYRSICRPDFFSHCAQKKIFSLNTYETSTGRPRKFEVNNRSSEILKNPWQTKDFVEDSLTSLLRNLCTIRTQKRRSKVRIEIELIYKRQLHLRTRSELLAFHITVTSFS